MAVFLVGLAFAPIFPTIVGITFAKFDASLYGSIFGIIFAIGLLGGTFVPKYIGNLSATGTVQGSLTIAAVMAGLLFVMALVMGAMRRKRVSFAHFRPVSGAGPTGPRWDLQLSVLPRSGSFFQAATAASCKCYRFAVSVKLTSNRPLRLLRSRHDLRGATVQIGDGAFSASARFHRRDVRGAPDGLHAAAREKISDA